MNRIETLKTEKDGLDVTGDLVRFAREGWKTIADDDKERLKWVGVFHRKPTPGHFMGISYCTAEPSRVGALIESAHSILAGLDPSDDMAYALWHGKLWSVHLNDQNGLKYDQDKVFGSVDLRRAFNTVWVLERGGYDGCVGLDVKAMRTTRPADQVRHLANSRQMFVHLLELVRSLDAEKVEAFRGERDYEGLEMYVLEHLMGK